MKLTGNQVDRIAEISDGMEVFVDPVGSSYVDVLRKEDGLQVRVRADGGTETLREAAPSL